MHQRLFRFKSGAIQQESQLLLLAFVPIIEYPITAKIALMSDSKLDTLRQQIDGIDDALHDLLMERAALSDQVRATKHAARPVLFRPGREAAILKRLLARHDGPLPPEAVVQVWREIIAASTRLQGPFRVAIYAPTGAEHALDLARAHFGVLTPLLPMSSVGPVLAALADDHAQVGLLPLPEETPDEPWWRGFGGGGSDALSIIARLPFAATSLQPAALIVGKQGFEPTGEDRGYLVVETGQEISRARLSAALEAADLKPLGTPAEVRAADGRGRTVATLLVETESYASPSDPRLAAARDKAGEGVLGIRSIGGYAVPLLLGRRRQK
jgi:chorismate mutase/prephenate dehydratase